MSPCSLQHRAGTPLGEPLQGRRAFLQGAAWRVPKASNREEVETKVAEIEKLIEQEKRTSTMPPDNPMVPGERQPVTTTTPPPDTRATTTTPPPQTTTTPPPETPEAQPTAHVSDIPTPHPEEKPVENHSDGKTKKIAGLTLVGVGVPLAIVGGGVCSALAVGAGNSVTSEAKNGNAFDPSKESAGHTDQIVAGVMYGVGGAALVAGAVVTYLPGFRDAKQASQARMLVPALSPTYAGGFAGSFLSRGSNEPYLAYHRPCGARRLLLAERTQRQAQVLGKRQQVPRWFSLRHRRLLLEEWPGAAGDDAGHVVFGHGSAGRGHGHGAASRSAVACADALPPAHQGLL